MGPEALCFGLSVRLCVPDMELGHWVTGSMGHLGHISRPGHRVIILTWWDPSFSGFRKLPKTQNVHLKCWNEGSHCQVSVVGLKSLDVTVSPCNELLLLPMIIKDSLAWEYFFAHKSTFGVHCRTGSPGQLGLRVAGFPGHWVPGSLGRWVTKCDPVPSVVCAAQNIRACGTQAEAYRLAVDF